VIPQEDDVILVLLVQSGDTAAFEKLRRRLHAPMRKYVRNLAGESNADDILQDVSWQVFRQIRHLREPKVFRAWAFRIATRISFHYLKRQKRRQDMENNPEFIRSIPIHTVLGPDEVDADFLSLIEHVSPSSRAVLLLYYQQHLSLEETAAILDIPFGTAKSRLSYGVATVRKCLKEKEEHEQIGRTKVRG
jgi:RNA polymerase sigma-70 factor (ECF subfamily)